MLQTRFAVCIDNSEYPVALELHKVYRIMPDDEAEADGDLRLIDASGEDYLFPAKDFVIIQPPHEVTLTLERSFASLAA